MLTLLLTAGASAAGGLLKPPDTSSPRATMESFLALTDEAAQRYLAFRDAPSPATQKALWRISEEATPLLDLSRVAPAARRKVADETFYLLWDVMARLELPDLAEMPGATAEGDGDEPAERPRRWRILDIVERAGTGFAVPSRTLYHTRDGGLDAERRQDAEKEVREWASAHRLPFPEFPPDYRDRIMDALDYPPEGSPGADRS